MKKRILFVINSLNCGGAEKSLVSLLNVIAESDYDLELQTFAQGGMFQSLLPEKVKLLDQLPYFAYCRGDGRKSISFITARIKAALLLRLRPRFHGKKLHDAQLFWRAAHNAFDETETEYDAAIAWGQGNPTHYVAEKVKAKKKIAFINVNYEAAGHNKRFDLPFYERYDSIVAVSEALNSIVKEVFPSLADRVVTIYDIRNQKMIRSMAEVHVPFQKDDDVLYLLTVGRMVAQKGYDLAVSAASILQAKRINFKWYFVGDGPEKRKIEAEIQKNDLQNCVFLSGAQNNPYSYMKNVDIYVQTSLFEGFCLTLCEARCVGTPVISTNFDVVFDQLKNGENGLIVEMNPEAIAEGIEKLYLDKQLYQHIVGVLRDEHLGNEDEVLKLLRLIE